MRAGMELGRRDGIKEGERKMIKKMKEKNMPIETIAELTELSIEEIEKI